MQKLLSRFSLILVISLIGLAQSTFATSSKTQINVLVSSCDQNDNANKLFQNQLEQAKQNNIAAQFNTGSAYWFGCGVNVNQDKAWYWLEKAAAAGDNRAQLHIGKAYFFGKGTERRPKKGLYWLKKAAEQGNADAQAILGIYYLRFNDVKAKDCHLSSHYLSQAARANQKDAQLFLGAAIAVGRCFEKNRDLGLQWIQLSAYQNQVDAMQIIEDAIDAEVYFNGEDAPYWR